jgi:class 3 adenylate cyclase
MSELPTGTVTFLFTDLEGSTRLWEEHPGAMRSALARHDAILRDAVESQGGSVVKTTGDGLHAVFATAESAVGAAVAMQRELAAQSWGDFGVMGVRVGIHTGEAELRAGDYFGSALNRAARLMAAAHGGQVVVSQATASVLHDDLPEGIGLLDLGEHRLRDLSRPERVFQVTHLDLVRDFAPLRSLDSFPGNLPLSVTSFVGRERELMSVTQSLSDARVVTLTGVGGVGKTRLALQVAAAVQSAYPDGSWLCELAGVRDPEAVPDALLAAFDMQARPGVTASDTVLELLGNKQILLIVDNCEHLLLAVARLVSAIERSCSGVEVLATSREGLDIDGERILVVSSLEMPDASDELDAIGQVDSVRLFVERAQAVSGDFALSPANADRSHRSVGASMVFHSRSSSRRPASRRSRPRSLQSASISDSRF